ncbi:TPA: zinc ribbon domain-containing protein [Thermoplasmata archaeon]|nr:zinc ribbon domain-containing protein [Thermoplasmata archaeon]
MMCPDCDHENSSDDRYCGRCGRKLLAPGSTDIPDWLLRNHCEEDASRPHREGLRRLETPYYTISWSSSQVRKWALLTTVMLIPLALFLLTMALVVDNLYGSVYFVILSMVLVLVCAVAWTRVRSVERAVYGENQERKGV